MTRQKLTQQIGIDGVAVKPSIANPDMVVDVPVDHVTIDFEGREHFPSVETLRDLRSKADAAVRVTIPLRADGFDPLGNRDLLDQLSLPVEYVFVAGHPDYLAPYERTRAVRPRLDAVVTAHPAAWIGTEGIEQLALDTGLTQFDLLAPGTEARVRWLRETGFTGEIAVYAPTVLTGNEDDILDAVGAYVARRGPIRRTLPPGTPTDHRVVGNGRITLLEGARGYALTGSAQEVVGRIKRLREAGVDIVVSYPARGVGAFTAAVESF